MRGSMVRTLDSGYSSAKDVAYSCGYCGYALNLSSSTRNTANIGSKYGKQIRKGVISFFAVDESRFHKLMNSVSRGKKYVIKINALQPSSDDSGVPFTFNCNPNCSSVCFSVLVA
ncbi:hypothetical protein GUJ93_ZPchr1247g22899 [Zizania palustris]|uniref:Uncharacterized protein n=1 Tax=Zizania palustris TaxID=103762 RepID=A0A8J5R2M5_ZIZPA|nr:hypothetical protein GUJ93_ZPchr1247g22899 [Zizania palustris]